jgi:hypothetical protein
MTDCLHKYVFRDAQTYQRYVNRYRVEFVRIDAYFCEKCLDIQERKLRVEINDDRFERAGLPDWAKTITTTVPGYEYT